MEAGCAAAQWAPLRAAAPAALDAADAPLAPWAQLPDSVLQLIGSSFIDMRQLEGAARACKGWRQGFASGITAIELSVHSDEQLWRNRVAHLRQLLPGLRRCKAHVGAGVGSALEAVSAMAEQLERMEHLELHLSEGCIVTGTEASFDFSAMRRLRSLALRGGKFTPAAAALLLRGLADACPHLEELILLPDALCGLGDGEMPLLADLPGLKRLEFQAYRLTGAGLLKLAALPALEALSVQGIDCLAGLETHCFRLCPSLKQLSLAGDYVPGPDVLERLREVEGLTMSFRATDKVNALLRTLTAHVTASLVKLDMGVVRIMSEEALQGVGQLSRLTDLRLAVTGNSDEPVTLRLDQLATLSNLRTLHLAKKPAYYPDRRRFGEAAVRVPFDAAGAAALADACRGLRALRLTLGAGDVLADGLERLSMFTALESLSIHAEPFRAGAPAAPLALAHLPRGLTSLDVKHVVICDHPEDLAAAPPLPALVALRLDAVRLRPRQLAALAGGSRRLARLRLSRIAGLSDEALACLGGMRDLEELEVAAPHNKSVTQRGLQALAPLRSLRSLTWQSDDLTSQGPILQCFTLFTSLRSLALSCTRRTMVLTHGEGYHAAFKGACPYINLSLINA